MVEGNAYITVNDPYQDVNENPFRNDNKVKKGEKGPLPFHIPKHSETGLFTKLEYKGGDVQEVISYVKTQPLAERKKGFGTKDAKRRDEFANSMRTEQHRATIRREQELLKKHLETFAHDHPESNNKNGLSISPTDKSSPETDDDYAFQFDIGRTRVTEFDPKQKKDTYFNNRGGTSSGTRNFNNTGGSTGTLSGSNRTTTSTARPKTSPSAFNYRPMSADWGRGVDEVEYKAPEHGGHSATSHFFDHSHIHLGQR